jgi:hypothetical protein
MIDDILTVFSTSRSARVLRGQLNGNRVQRIFAESRDHIAARTLHSQIRDSDVASGVTWSLWIGKSEKAIPWLLSGRYKETRYAFLLLLEHAGMIGVLGSGVGDAAERVSKEKIGYQKMLALHADYNPEIESLSTRNLRAANFGVMRSTQTGRKLESTLPRVGANQAAPLHLSLRHEDEAWRISPGSGRITVTGGRMTIDQLCAWFVTTCAAIDCANEPCDLIKAYAHPVALDELPNTVVPSALQLDPSIVDDLLGADGTLSKDGVDLGDSERNELYGLLRQLWLVDEPRNGAERAAKIWPLRANEGEIGKLVFRKTKISLSSQALTDVHVRYADGTTETLNQVYNDVHQPFRLTFSEASYSYTAGQLFRDHRLMKSREALLDLLCDRLPADAVEEKGEDGDAFCANSLFGFVARETGAQHEHVVCDDMGTEWADFIAVSSSRHEVTFYHCKGGKADVGASGLHELVSQATKNLGYLTASEAELFTREEKWSGNWKKTAIARLVRGSSVSCFIDAFAKAVAAPQATRRVVLVTSSLSRSAVSTAFTNLSGGVAKPEPLHVLWLLWSFVDQCRNVGATPEVVCRP